MKFNFNPIGKRDGKITIIGNTPKEWVLDFGALVCLYCLFITFLAVLLVIGQSVRNSGDTVCHVDLPLYARGSRYGMSFTAH
jgi:hypothetical protein